MCSHRWRPHTCRACGFSLQAHATRAAPRLFPQSTHFWQPQSQGVHGRCQHTVGRCQPDAGQATGRCQPCSQQATVPIQSSLCKQQASSQCVRGTLSILHCTFSSELKLQQAPGGIRTEHQQATLQQTPISWPTLTAGGARGTGALDRRESQPAVCLTIPHEAQVAGSALLFCPFDERGGVFGPPHFASALLWHTLSACEELMDKLAPFQHPPTAFGDD